MPGGYKNITPEDGKQWEKGVSGNPNGRPPKLYSKYKEFGYKAAQIREAFGIALGLNAKQIKEVIADPEADFLFRGACRSVEKWNATGDYSRAQPIVDQIAGRAMQQTHVIHDTVTYGIEKLTDNELAAKIAQLEESLGGVEEGTVEEIEIRAEQEESEE